MFEYIKNITRVLKTIDNPLKNLENVSNKDALEREFYNKEAEKYSQNFDENLFRYDENEPFPPRHRFFYSLLENVKRKDVLDCCCEYGFTSVKLAKRGAFITGIDISPKMIKLAKKNAEFNNISQSVNLKVMSVQDMLFADNTFDYAVGIGALHHLNLKLAGKEISRVSKPGGRAIFPEPRIPFTWIMTFRSFTPIACSESPGGSSMSDREIYKFSRNFSNYNIYYFMLLEKIFRVPFLNKFASKVYKADFLLINKLPCVRKLCWAFVLEFIK